MRISRFLLYKVFLNLCALINLIRGIVFDALTYNMSLETSVCRNSTNRSECEVWNRKCVPYVVFL